MKTQVAIIGAGPALPRLGRMLRLNDEGLPHDGFNLADSEQLIGIDIAEFTDKQAMAYSQMEITRDMIEAALQVGFKEDVLPGIMKDNAARLLGLGRDSGKSHPQSGC